MALVDNAWYVDTVSYAATTAWAIGTAKAAGALVRQNAAPAVGNERVFVCIVAGTTHATTEPTWTVTRGAKTTDNTVTWQEVTGLAGVNGDLTNTPSWTITATPPGGVKNTAVTLGQIIKRDNGASYQICTTAGTAGNGAEPAFSDTAGVTTADNTVTWTSLGVVGNFTGWQAPHARLGNAYATNWGQAGNRFFLASSHAETQTTTSQLQGPGTAASRTTVICVTKTTIPPVGANVTTGASIAVTGSGNALTVSGFATYDGIRFLAGTSTTVGNFGTCNLSATGHLVIIKNGSIVLNNSHITSAISFAASSSVKEGKTVLINTNFKFGSVSQIIASRVMDLEWYNTPNGIDSAGSFPTALFSFATLPSFSAKIVGVDLSSLGSGKTIFNTGLNTFGPFYGLLKNCKLGSSVTVSSVPPSRGAGRIDVVNCDTGTANYRNEVYLYEGVLTTETTIVRTGGASDGTTPIAWKVVTTAGASFYDPFDCPPIAIWNDDTGAPITATIECRAAAISNDDEVWVEIEYLGSAGSPVSSLVSDCKTNFLATAAAQASSSETWGGSTASFKLSTTFTPAMAGFVYARVMVAKPSATIYIDPKITLS